MNRRLFLQWLGAAVVAGGAVLAATPKTASAAVSLRLSRLRRRRRRRGKRVRRGRAVLRIR